MAHRTRLVIIAVLLLLLCVSCRTVETKTEYVYVKENIDIQDSLELLFDSRPEDYTPDIPEETYLFKNTNDYELALVATEGLLEQWEDYSYALEQFLSSLAETLKGDAAT